MVKTITLKKYTKTQKTFTCMCGKECQEGIPVDKIVSSNFTEWNRVTEFVCKTCADMFSLFKYSYIVDNEGIRLLNIREMAKAIQEPQNPPFKTIVSISQKKHLFYKAIFNNNPNNFVVNLEEEKIHCDLQKLKEQFLFISSLQALGESKERLKKGEIRHDILLKIGHKTIKYLSKQLGHRQVQIPLFLSQKLNISEDEALCNLDLILNR